MAMLGLGILVFMVIIALSADLLFPKGFDDQMISRRFQLPNSEYWFGTDNLGRGILDRMVHGARVSLSIGLFAVTISIVFGGLLGAMAGFYGGKVDNIIMRSLDVLLAIPSILLAISIVSALGGGLFNVMLAVGISSIPGYARIVRASVITLKGQEFIEAARAIGASDKRIILRHIIPNALAPIIVQGTLGVAGAILSAAGLSFIGLGLAPPNPEWGAMLSGGRQFIRDHWPMTLFPGLAIMITIFALNLLGDGLRDALDPKLRN
ncbi:MAG TPA: ABC transporter permease [Tissierellia bacterium]|nr:ABC transporter permease [Tissierellia bacterium]